MVLVLQIMKVYGNELDTQKMSSVNPRLFLTHTPSPENTELRGELKDFSRLTSQEYRGTFPRGTPAERGRDAYGVYTGTEVVC